MKNDVVMKIKCTERNKRAPQIERWTLESEGVRELGRGNTPMVFIEKWCGGEDNVHGAEQESTGN